MPAGAEVTVPVPVPALETANVYWVRVKVAVTVVAAARVTTQEPVPLQPPPLQPEKIDPEGAVAYRMTWESLGASVVQVAPQVMPAGDEVTPGLRWMTLRSDGQDKFAQPEGRWIGSPGKPTNVNAEGPALKGALNIVLPGRDHREVSYHADAFAKTYEFLTGQPPRTLARPWRTSITAFGSV